MINHAQLSLALASSAVLTLSVACSSSSETGEMPVSTALAVVTASPIVSGIGGKCLDDHADLTVNFNKIQIWQCNGTAAQSWSYTNGTLVGPGGKCLDIRGDNQAPGTVVDLYQCNGTNAQKWTLSGTVIKSTAGYCLDVAGGVNADGTQVELADCVAGSPSQAWRMTASTPASCTFDGRTIASGATVSPAPYKSATVPHGQTCTTETVTCENGVLSPGNASPTCTVLPATSTPALRQYAVGQTNGGASVWEVDSVKQFTTPTQKGNALWVVATIPNDGAQRNVTVTDTQGNVFVALDFEEDTGKGTQSVWQFYAGNIKGDTGAADTVTVHWGSDNYKGVLIAEVEGVTSAPLVGHHGDIQDFNAPTGDNTVTSGGITVGSAQTPALLLALSMDTFGGTSDTGGDGYAGPLYGDGFSGQADLWNFDPGSLCAGVACNLAAFEIRNIPSAGSEAGLFTARAPASSANPGSYVTVSTVFH